MPIFAEVQERLFRIRTAHTEYQMCADSYGVLKHLWYGVPVGHSMDYLRKYPDVGFAGNLYEAGNDRTYSLNTLPQEYAGAGVGDYRISAANVRHADGSQALDLRYQNYAIKPGKYSIPGLPAVYADAADAETLEITLRDAASGVEVVLQYGVLPELDIITRSAVFRNTGASPVDALPRQTRHGADAGADSAVPRRAGELQRKRHFQPSAEPLCGSVCAGLHRAERQLHRRISDVQRQLPDTDRAGSAGSGASGHGTASGFV